MEFRGCVEIAGAKRRGPPVTLSKERLLEPPEGARLSFRRRIIHPKLRYLYDYWLQHSPDGSVMARAAFDPLDMPGLLKNLILSDVGDGGRTIQYRVVGTEIVAAHGFDYTGWTIDRLTSGPTLVFTQKLYGIVVTHGVPVYSEGHFRWEKKEYRWTRRLHLPLSRDGDGKADMVLVGQFFGTTPGEGELLQPATPAELAADRAAAPSGPG